MRGAAGLSHGPPPARMWRPGRKLTPTPVSTETGEGQVSLLTTQQQGTDQIQQAFTQHFHAHVSNHGPNAVSATITRLGGDSNRISATIDSAWPKSRKLLQDWTDVRHRIVHQGKSEQIRRPNAEDCIKLILKIVVAVDSESLKASASS